MKKLLTTGASALALSIAASGAAQAQDSTVAAEIGVRLINLINAEFQDGIGLNMALNTARIDGSVDVVQGNFTFDESFELSAAVGADAATVSFGSVDLVDAAGALAVEVSPDEEITKVNLGDIDTLAVGAINDGAIRFGQAGTESMDLLIETFEESNGVVGADVTASAASTTNTAAAFYSTDFYADGGSLGSSLTDKVTEAAYGPALDFFAMNVAFNNTDIIDGSVDILGNGMSATAIGTTAVGAVNTGIIESGLCSGACGL